MASRAIAQSAPVSWNRPWHSPDEKEIARYAMAEQMRGFDLNPVKFYSLAELIDLAESHNPETRVAWERARAQAASLGVARSELYPALAAAALSETGRAEVFFGNRFDGQITQAFEVALDLKYTVFDFGARSGRINAARAQRLAANFAFNNTHRSVIYQVEQAYYRLLNSTGQEEAVRASLSNAQVVQQAAEDRLAHGLANSQVSSYHSLLRAHSGSSMMTSLWHWRRWRSGSRHDHQRNSVRGKIGAHVWSEWLKITVQKDSHKHSPLSLRRCLPWTAESEA